MAYCFSRSSVKFQGTHGTKNPQCWPESGVSGLKQFEFTYCFEMMHKAWRSIEEVPYCFSKSSIKLQGHYGPQNRRVESNFSKITRRGSQLSKHQICIVFTRSQFWPSDIVVACFCVSVSLCVNHLLVRAIAQDPFKLGSQNLDKGCKRPRLRSLLFSGPIAIDLHGQIQLKSPQLPHFELVRTITHDLFKLGSSNLDQRCRIH